MPHLHGCKSISISAYKMSTLENNTLFETSISRKTNKFLEFFQRAYVVLLIKQHTCKVSTLGLYEQKTIELFQFFTSNSTFSLATFSDEVVTPPRGT